MNRFRTLLLATLVFGLTDAALAQVEKPAPCPPSPCGKDCTNQPYTQTDCWTTEYGPARSDVIIVKGDGPPTSSSNMLRCSKGPYALCFYSGPPYATGTGGNAKLPCLLNGDGKTASCTCQYYADKVSYVDINGILNLRAWYEAVEECGADGSLCANMRDCKEGEHSSHPVCSREATVCQYVRNQNEKDASVSLIPGADVISTFGFAMASSYDMKGTTPCGGAFAGCMTAGCQFPAGVTKPADGSPVTCQCPLAAGPYQIGQIGPDVKCAILPSVEGGYTWSASRTINLDLHIDKPAGN